MAGYVQFENLERYKGELLLSNAFISGTFNLWFPFIELESPCNVGIALTRFALGRVTEEDQELFYTFFHEYLHLIQSARYFACQLPIIFTHNIIYDIRVTAINRRSRRETRLCPLDISENTKNIEIAIKNEFESISDYREPFSVVNILEGSARLLEEKFRGCEVEQGHWRYSAIKEINESILSKRRLSDRALLDLCDISLRRKNPARTFVELLRAIDKFGVVCDDGAYETITQLADKLGCESMPSLANLVVGNSARIFNSPLYAHYLGQVNLLYGQLPRIFGDGRVLSLVYDQLSNDNGKGMPNCMLKWIYKCGSPVVINSEGRMEIFDVNIKQSSQLDQNILGIKSVVESIRRQDSKKCMMMETCVDANKYGRCLPVDDNCRLQPWIKRPVNGMICPFVAIWKAFGLEGLRP